MTTTTERAPPHDAKEQTVTDAQTSISDGDLTPWRPAPAQRLWFWLAMVAALAGIAAMSWLLLLRKPPEPAAMVPTVTVTPERRVEGNANDPAWTWIRTAKVQKERRLAPLPVPARVQWDESTLVRVAAPVSGRVVAVHVQAGERVVAGQSLVDLRSREWVELVAEEKNAAILTAAAARDRARIRAMVADGSAPTKDLLAADLLWREASAKLETARRKKQAVAAQGTTNGQTVVRAPRAGVVVRRLTQVGDEVSPGPDGTLVEIGDSAEVVVHASVSELQAIGLAEGETATVTAAGLPGRTWSGKVERIAPMVDPVLRRVDVRVRVANPAGDLRPGAFAQVGFEADPGESVVVPSAAVVSDDERLVVYVQERAGRFAERAVQIGRERDGKTELLGGVEPGETVVVEHALLLRNLVALNVE